GAVIGWSVDSAGLGGYLRHDESTHYFPGAPSDRLRRPVGLGQAGLCLKRRQWLSLLRRKGDSCLPGFGQRTPPDVRVGRRIARLGRHNVLGGSLPQASGTGRSTRGLRAARQLRLGNAKLTPCFVACRPLTRKHHLSPSDGAGRQSSRSAALLV